MNRYQKSPHRPLRDAGYRKAFQRLDEALEDRKNGRGLTDEEKRQQYCQILGISREWMAKRGL
jgi:hypothetical protein